MKKEPIQESEKPRGQIIYECIMEMRQIIHFRDIHRGGPYPQEIDSDEVLNSIIDKYNTLCVAHKLTESEKENVAYQLRDQINAFGEEAISSYKFNLLRTSNELYRNNIEALKRVREELNKSFYMEDTVEGFSIDAHYIVFLKELGIIKHLRDKYQGISDTTLSNLITVISNGIPNIRENLRGLSRKGGKGTNTAAAQKSVQKMMEKLGLK